MEKHLSQTRYVCVCGYWFRWPLHHCGRKPAAYSLTRCGGANEMETAVGTEISVTSILSKTLSFVQIKKNTHTNMKRKGKKNSARETRLYYDTSLRLQYFIVLGDFFHFFFFSICVRLKGLVA